jgi:hypothetical protein
MTATFVEFTKPTMMPGGGLADTGENIGFDPVTAANLIASGVAASGSAPGAYVLPALTRVKIVAPFIPVGAPIYSAGVFVGVSPATFFAGDITGLSTAIAAALIAAGLAVSN